MQIGARQFRRCEMEYKLVYRKLVRNFGSNIKLIRYVTPPVLYQGSEWVIVVNCRWKNSRLQYGIEPMWRPTKDAANRPFDEGWREMSRWRTYMPNNRSSLGLPMILRELYLNHRNQIDSISRTRAKVENLGQILRFSAFSLLVNMASRLFKGATSSDILQFCRANRLYLYSKISA
jgi:hypothetical protein